MGFNSLIVVLAAIAAIAAVPAQATAGTSPLGTAGNFAILSGEGISNTGATTINGGDVGIHPGVLTDITGFGTVTGAFTIHAADAVALQAKNDLATGYTTLAGLAPSNANDYTTFNGGDLTGLTLKAGVYKFSSTALLTGTLTLDFEGDPDALFVFQVGSGLTVGVNASVVAINGGSGPGCSVFWQVTSSAMLNTDSTFIGHIVALTSIQLKTGATLYGSALARNGAVTLESNTIANVVCGDVAVVPLPSSAWMGLGLLSMAWIARRHLARRPDAA